MITLRKALMKDVPAMHAMLMKEADKGLLLPRSQHQIYTAMRDFYVAETEDGTIAGCCALAIMWEGSAEVRSLTVAENCRRMGIGVKLVDACMQDARDLGIPKVFTLTYQTEFFSRCGFTEVPKESLPQKIWTVCINCPKFPNCDETAMIRDA